MKNIIKSLPYKITEDHNYINKLNLIPKELFLQLDNLYDQCSNTNNKAVINRLINLIEKYPQVEILKNYLYVAYMLRDEKEKALEIMELTTKLHPNYLFGKLNLANLCIEQGKLEEVPEILGITLELHDLYPERDTFHLSEITNYYKTVIRYYVSADEIEKAENKSEFLKEIAPEHPDTTDSSNFVFASLMKKGMARFEEHIKNRISVKVPTFSPENSIDEKPVFTHSQIQYLYEYGINISGEKLNEILALPRETLISDLEKVLDDAVMRYNYFKGIDYEEKTHSFVLHALFLLMEVNAEESLPKVLSFLEYDHDFFEVYLGEHKTETLWQCIYKLGFNQTDKLEQHLSKPGIDTYNKTPVSDALCQYVLHHPEKREEILNVYSNVFNTFLNAKFEDNLIDSEFLGFAVSDTVDCEFNELLPLIKQLYEKKYVSLGICGDYEDIEEEFSYNEKRDHKREIFNIFELYNDVLSTWSGYRESKEKAHTPTYDFYNKPEQAVSEKIGRNEPCPCGSGKKYKKCCMNK